MLFIQKLPILQIYFSFKLFRVFIRTNYGFKIISFKTMMYLSFVSFTKLFLLFFSLRDFNGFLIQIANIRPDIYFFKLKIKGLGYRLRYIASNFFYIFFNYTNFFYIFVNSSLILIRIFKRRMILISFLLFELKLFLSHILLLHKIGPYTLEGMR